MKIFKEMERRDRTRQKTIKRHYAEIEDSVAHSTVQRMVQSAVETHKAVEGDLSA